MSKLKQNKSDSHKGMCDFCSQTMESSPFSAHNINKFAWFYPR